MELFSDIKIPECLNDLERQRIALEQYIVKCEGSLNMYHKEVDALRAKYNVDTICNHIQLHRQERDGLCKSIYCVKFKYIARLIYHMTHDNLKLLPEIPSKKAISQFFQWLEDKYGIRYHSEYKYIGFDTFYKDHIEDEDISSNLELTDNEATVSAEYLFRSELDDAVALIIPIAAFSAIESIASDFDGYFDHSLREQQRKYEAKQRENEQREYEQYLKLREKFEGKHIEAADTTQLPPPPEPPPLRTINEGFTE